MATLARLRLAASGLLAAETVLGILANLTLVATDKKPRHLKLVCRYQQYRAANRIVGRVVAGRPTHGLIWHVQGSGRSLRMVFAAPKRRLHPRLEHPTVLVVVDRIDPDTQIGGTFRGADVADSVKAETRRESKTLLRQDTRKIIIATIFTFGEETPCQTIARLAGPFPEPRCRGDRKAARGEMER